MNLKSGNAVSTPGVPELPEEANRRINSPELSRTEATRYRGIAARINYLSLDRPDLQYAAKGVSKHMSQPREHDWIAVKRMARYLVGAPRALQTFQWQSRPDKITTYVDSDWAGDRATRKSTSGGAMCWGKHLIKSWSTTQQIIALSSGEAELYALIKGAAQSKGLAAMLADYDVLVDATVCTDASAAIGIVHRKGLGKTRHIHVQYLWVQCEVSEERLKVEKVSTHENPADLLTKNLAQEKLSKFLAILGYTISASRAKTAPELLGT
jgi:hypothetical protein